MWTVCTAAFQYTHECGFAVAARLDCVSCPIQVWPWGYFLSLCPLWCGICFQYKLWDKAVLLGAQDPGRPGAISRIWLFTVAAYIFQLFSYFFLPRIIYPCKGESDPDSESYPWSVYSLPANLESRFSVSAAVFTSVLTLSRWLGPLPADQVVYLPLIFFPRRLSIQRRLLWMVQDCPRDKFGGRFLTHRKKERTEISRVPNPTAAVLHCSWFGMRVQAG